MAIVETFVLLCASVCVPGPDKQQHPERYVHGAPRVAGPLLAGVHRHRGEDTLLQADGTGWAQHNQRTTQPTHNTTNAHLPAQWGLTAVLRPSLFYFQKISERFSRIT